MSWVPAFGGMTRGEWCILIQTGQSWDKPRDDILRMLKRFKIGANAATRAYKLATTVRHAQPHAATRCAAVSSTIAEHFSPIMIEGAFVLPEVNVGMIEASATRRPEMPCTRN
jgi:hypothetical protein